MGSRSKNSARLRTVNAPALVAIDQEDAVPQDTVHEVGRCIVDDHELNLRPSEIAAEVVFYIEHQAREGSFVLAGPTEHCDIDVTGGHLGAAGTAAEEPCGDDIVSRFEPLPDGGNDRIPFHEWILPDRSGRRPGDELRRPLLSFRGVSQSPRHISGS